MNAAVRTGPEPAHPRSPSPRLLERIAWALAAAAALAQLASLVFGRAELGGALALALLVGGWLLLRWRRWLGILVMFIAPAVCAEFGSEPLISWTVVVFATFALVIAGAPALAVGAAAMVGNYGAVLISLDYAPLDPEALTAGATSVAVAAVAAAIRAQHSWFEEVHAHAASEIATRGVEADRRVAEERLRIARDLHDGVGHEAAGLSMQLGLAEVLLPAGADAARDALAGARERVKSITAETHAILDVLRIGDEVDDLEPLADAGGIRDLVASFAAVGLAVDAEIGELPALDRGASTAAYRVVQEALTNASRHGDGTATLAVLSAGGEVVIDVVNPVGAATPGGRRGYGLIGMRERMQSARGRLEAAEEDGSFRVHAVLPADGTERR